MMEGCCSGGRASISAAVGALASYALQGERQEASGYRTMLAARMASALERCKVAARL